MARTWGLAVLILLVNTFSLTTSSQATPRPSDHVSMRVKPHLLGGRQYANNSSTTSYTNTSQYATTKTVFGSLDTTDPVAASSSLTDTDSLVGAFTANSSTSTSISRASTTGSYSYTSSTSPSSMAAPVPVNTSVTSTKPTSLEDINANYQDSKGNPLLPDALYKALGELRDQIDSSLIMQQEAEGSCVAYPDDPCIRTDTAAGKAEVLKILRCEYEGCSPNGTDYDGHDHGGIPHDDEDDEENDDDDDEKVLAGLLGGVVGGGVALSTLGAWGWYHKHGTTWKVGEYIWHRSQSLWEFLRGKLSPADIPQWGFENPPTPPPPGPRYQPPPDTAPPDFVPPDTGPPDLSPLELPPPNLTPPDLSSPNHSPPDLSTPDHLPPNLSSPDHSPPDLSTPDHSPPDLSSPDLSLPDLIPPSGPPTDPGKKPDKPGSEDAPEKEPEDPEDDCPPKLQKAQAELNEKNRKIAKLEQALKDKEKKLQKAEKDLDDCEEETKKLHEAQQRLHELAERNPTPRYRKTQAELNEKQKVVDQLIKRVSETAGYNADLKQQLADARSKVETLEGDLESQSKSVKAFQEKASEIQKVAQFYIDSDYCHGERIKKIESDCAEIERQRDAFSNLLHETESRLDDATSRAATAEGSLQAHDEELTRLRAQNKELVEHTCPVAILSQTQTCKHTNEEIARMKLNLDACNYDRKRLRKPDPRPEVSEQDLPLAEQLERCKNRWHKTLAAKASLSAQYDDMVKLYDLEAARLKDDLATCERELSGRPREGKPKEQPMSAKERIAKLEKDIARCKAEKAEAKKLCKGGPPPSPPGSPHWGDGAGDAAGDPRAGTLNGCRQVLGEASLDAHECYSQCTCPAGVIEGPGHRVRRAMVKRWLEVGDGFEVGGGNTSERVGNLSYAAMVA